mmetsp:Transcript_37272/g.79132  ORF Transcript_37272/g.79132 Transcript_37272/m.79132 type:complete len:369 (+) Transcript_37272:94-1200(+)
MALTAVTPVEPLQGGVMNEEGIEEFKLDVHLPEPDILRIALTRPSDEENDLIQVAVKHGAGGILAVMRKYKDWSWMTVLCFRAIQMCLSPRRVSANILPVLKDCDPVLFSIEMMELEMIDEIFYFMRYYSHIKDIHHHGLAIMELLIMDDAEWRDEVARKGGALLVVDIAALRKESPSIMCQVMTCMSYLASEDYIEVMLCTHDALTYVTYCLQEQLTNQELVTRACLALLNMSVCEPHVEELMDKGGLAPVLDVLQRYASDIHLVIIAMGIVANFSTLEDARKLLVKEGVLKHIGHAMRLEPKNSVLQVACLKAAVNYSTNPEHYMMMETLGIPTLVGQAMVDHVNDPGVQRYANYFLGSFTRCPIL